MREETLYKVTVNGRSCHGGNLAWSLPTQQPDGTWTPGEWHEVAGPVRPCSHGLHVTAVPARWFVESSPRDCELWEVETDGLVIAHSDDKHIAQRVRLLRRAAWAAHGVYIVDAGEHTVRDGRRIASGSATVRASDSATVVASGSATVWASDSAAVWASVSATVVASDSATVRASGSATVVQPRVHYGNQSTVTLGGEAVCVDRRGAVVVCRVAGQEVRDA